MYCRSRKAGYIVLRSSSATFKSALSTEGPAFSVFSLHTADSPVRVLSPSLHSGGLWCGQLLLCTDPALALPQPVLGPQLFNVRLWPTVLNSSRYSTLMLFFYCKQPLGIDLWWQWVIFILLLGNDNDTIYAIQVVLIAFPDKAGNYLWCQPKAALLIQFLFNEERSQKHWVCCSGLWACCMLHVNLLEYNLSRAITLSLVHATFMPQLSCVALALLV